MTGFAPRAVTMSELHIAFVGYFLAIGVIGFAAWRSTKSVLDYAIGGRRLSAPVAALSAGASDMSGWLLLGLPGAVFAAGVGESWIVIGLAVGAWSNWHWTAPRLRDDTHALGSVTVPQFLSQRTGSGRGLRVLTSGVILGFFTLYTAGGFVAGAKLFEDVLQIDYRTALGVGVVIIMAYTAVGGFLAVSWSDVFQALLMLLALVAVPAVGATLLASSSTPVGVDWHAFSSLEAIGLISLAAWGLGYFGQPHVLARFMAMAPSTDVGAARRIGMSWMVVTGVGAIAVGLVGAAYVGPLDDPETVFLALSRAVLNPYVAGIVIAGILAAVMSTVDSQLLVASTALVEDVLAGLELDGPRRLWVSRAMVVGIALIAGAIALDPASSVLDIVAYAWAGLGASLGPSVLFCLYWRRTTATGVVSGILAGAATVVVWRNMEGGWWDLYEIVPAFLLSAACIVACGLVRPSARAQRTFDRLRGDSVVMGP